MFEVNKPNNTPKTMPIASLIPLLLLINFIIVRFLICELLLIDNFYFNIMVVFILNIRLIPPHSENHPDFE